MTTQYQISSYGGKTIISFPIRYKGRTFHYDSLGRLTYKDHSYCKDVAQFLPRLEPVRTRTGQIAVRQPPPPPTKSLKWWKAQCLFRGLEWNGKVTVENLQTFLHGHKYDSVTPELLNLHIWAGEEYNTKIEGAVEDYWRRMSDEQKINDDPRRFFAETFPADGTSQQVVVVKKDPFELANKLESHIVCEAVIVAFDPYSPDSSKEIWAVVGQDKALVLDKVRLIWQDSSQARREYQEMQMELKRKEDKIKRKEQETKRKRKKALERVALCRDWDVTGKWKISCGEIEHNWDQEDLELDIFVTDTPKGPQIFAKFEFGLVHGIFRFEKYTPYEYWPSDDEDEDDDEDGEESEEEEEEEEDDDDEEFYLDVPKPSKMYNDWKYRWRGETLRGEIQRGSDESVYQLWFDEYKKGRVLEGTFGGCTLLDRNCFFKGVKIDTGVPPNFDISKEWARYSEEAHDKALN